MERDPEARPGAEEVGAALDAVAEGKDVPEPPIALQDAVPDVEAVAAATADDAVVQAESAPDPAPTPKPQLKSRRPRRSLLIALGVLLLAGLVLGTFVESVLGKDSWTAHRREGMDAVLSLPSQYRLLQTRATSGSRTVTYGTGALRVRLTEWDKAVGAPLAEARSWAEATSDPHYTRTSFRGNKDAILADTTYEQSGVPTRAMALIIRTADHRMYQLRVDMPKGTPDEKKGTALFKGARDRLALTEK